MFRRHDCIAAVVALAGDEHYAAVARHGHRLRHLEDARARALHQFKARHERLLNGAPVQFAHLFSSDDFHGNVVDDS